jgi:UDPglucose--hexose-1-phosphate uridylyltransferase
MPELRKDPVLGRWVIVSSERAKRPSDFGEACSVEANKGPMFCPFCEGNESKTPPEILAYRDEGSQPNGPGWKLRVVPNKYPALQIEGSLGKKGVGIYDRMNGIGAHEVVIETPHHCASITGLTDAGTGDVFRACRDRLADLRGDTRMVCGMVFKNVGEAAGASVEHTHTQIIVTPVVPRTVQQEMDGCKRFFDYRGRCLICDIVEQEESEGTRVVAANEQFVAFNPYASRFPFETWVVPRTHESHFERLGDGEADDLGRIIRATLAKIERALCNPPYNYMVHTAPLPSPALEHYHWHVEIIPRLTKVAGFEWGTGFYINPVPPESAAEYLREVEV